MSVLGVVGVAVWVWWRRPPAPAGTALLLGALLLATSPVQPWYAVSLLAVAALAASPVWVAVVAAGYPYFFAVILASRHTAALGEAVYGARSWSSWPGRSCAHVLSGAMSAPGWHRTDDGGARG